MEVNLYWQALRWLALEHLHLREDESGIHAAGLVVGAFDGAPLRLRYQVECDRGWRTTTIRVDDLISDQRIELHRPAGEGWCGSQSVDAPELSAAIDVDIAATPFTNTLPIRRLGLEPGQAEEITVVYVAVTPSLSFRPVRQRYTRLRQDRDVDHYFYESLESDFRRELVVDSKGFVIDYPGIWQRADG